MQTAVAVRETSLHYFANLMPLYTFRQMVTPLLSVPEPLVISCSPVTAYTVLMCHSPC